MLSRPVTKAINQAVVGRATQAASKSQSPLQQAALLQRHAPQGGAGGGARWGGSGVSGPGMGGGTASAGQTFLGYSARTTLKIPALGTLTDQSQLARTLRQLAQMTARTASAVPSEHAFLVQQRALASLHMLDDVRRGIAEPQHVAQEDDVAVEEDLQPDLTIVKEQPYEPEDAAGAATGSGEGLGEGTDGEGSAGAGAGDSGDTGQRMGSGAGAAPSGSPALSSPPATGVPAAHALSPQGRGQGQIDRALRQLEQLTVRTGSVELRDHVFMMEKRVVASLKVLDDARLMVKEYLRRAVGSGDAAAESDFRSDLATIEEQQREATEAIQAARVIYVREALLVGRRVESAGAVVSADENMLAKRAERTELLQEREQVRGMDAQMAAIASGADVAESDREAAFAVRASYEAIMERNQIDLRRVVREVEEAEQLFQSLLPSAKTGNLGARSERNGVAAGASQEPSALESALNTTTRYPEFRLGDGVAPAVSHGQGDEFADSAAAWLTRNGLYTGEQVSAMMGSSALESLGRYGSPAVEPVGVGASMPSEELTNARIDLFEELRGARARAQSSQAEEAGGSEAWPQQPGLQGAEPFVREHGVSYAKGNRAEEDQALIPAISQLRPLAGPVWMVTTAPGQVSQSGPSHVDTQQRSDGSESTSWSPVEHRAETSRFYSQLEHQEALDSFQAVINGVTHGAIATHAGAQLTRHGLKSLFSLITASTHRIAQTAVSGAVGLGYDITTLVALSQGPMARTAGLAMAELKDAPFEHLWREAQGLGGKIQQTAEDFQEKMSHLLDQAPEKVQQVAAMSTGALQKMWEVAKAQFEVLGGKLKGLWAWAQEAWSGILPKVTTYLKDLSVRVANAIKKFPGFNKALSVMQKAVEIALENVADLFQKFAFVLDLTQSMEKLIDTAKKALLESAPAKAFQVMAEKLQDWAAQYGGELYARLSGGREGFERSLKRLTANLGRFTEQAGDYALSRAYHEGSKSSVGDRLVTQRPLLGFRNLQAARDYALMRASTEPGDRHVVFMQVDLDDWRGRDLGPLMMYSPHYRGQDVMLLPGAHLAIRHTGIVETAAGRMEIVAAKEMAPPQEDLAGYDQFSGRESQIQGLENLTWLGQQERQDAVTGGSLLRGAWDISTRAYAFRHISKLVNEYYGGNIDDWARAVLGTVAGDLYQSIATRYETKGLDQNDRAAKIAGFALRVAGLGEPVAIFVEQLVAGKSLATAIHAVRVHRGHFPAANKVYDTMISVALEKIEHAVTTKEEKEAKTTASNRNAAVIGAVMGLIEILVKAGPEKVVDTVLGQGGVLGAAATAGLAHRFAPDKAHQIVKGTYGTTAAVASTATRAAVQSAMTVGHQLINHPGLALYNAYVRPRLPELQQELGGGSVSDAVADLVTGGGEGFGAGAARVGAGGIATAFNFVTDTELGHKLASLGEEGRKDFVTVSVAASAGLGRLAAASFAARRTVDPSEMGQRPKAAAL